MEYRVLFQFYLICLLLNIVAIPLCYLLFSKFKDGGIFIGKSLGIYIVGYITWLLSSLKIMRFSLAAIVVSVVILAVFMYSPICFQIIKQDNHSFGDYIKRCWKQALIGEMIFLALFIAFNIILAFKVSGTDTERMMDLGFMYSMSKTDYMPPLDMWASGEYINYYYFGQYIITFITKAACIPIEYGYTFGFVLIIAFVLVACYRLVQEITNNSIAGILSAMGVVFAGNFQYIVFYKIVPMMWDILRLDGNKPTYWFADSTRYIGYIPEVSNDKTIHEFPAYSFIVGDLHAHVINMLIVLVILTILWSFISQVKEKITSQTTMINACIIPEVFMLGFLLGICSMSNYWDLPIYYVVAGSIIFFGMMNSMGICKKLFLYTAIDGMLIWMINMLVSLPFDLKFVKMVQGIGVVEHRSLMHQLVLLWGFPIVMSFIFIVLTIKHKVYNQKNLFITLLCLCSIGLVIIPEFIFIKDIYIDAYPRANTMFKLSYQAFIMFSICIGCIIDEIFNISKNVKDYISYRYKRIGVIAIICLLLCCTYFPVSMKMWVGKFSKESYDGFNAAKTIKELNYDEMPAIEFLIKTVEAGEEKQPVVLEAEGDSYTNSCRVSVLTGYPTVLGWHTHEWLWHNSYSYMEARRIDVERFYSSDNIDEKHLIIKKYGIDYIYIGLKEYDRYEIVQNKLLESLGTVVYCEAISDGRLIEIIKVD